jgi:hypothetical protein
MSGSAHSRSKSGFGSADAMTTSIGSSAAGKPLCAAPAHAGRGDERLQARLASDMSGGRLTRFETLWTCPRA